MEKIERKKIKKYKKMLKENLEPQVWGTIMWFDTIGGGGGGGRVMRGPT